MGWLQFAIGVFSNTTAPGAAFLSVALLSLHRTF